MYILSLETSTKNFSLAISKDEKVLRFRNVRTDRILESSMIDSIDKLLASCDLNLDKVDALAIGLGPGSFTSLRVGLSTVKAFALATGKKLVGICSLDVLASGVVPNESIGTKTDEICVLADARRGKVYAAIYDVRNGFKPFLTEHLLTTIEDVLKLVHGTTLFVGDGILLYKEQIEAAYRKHLSFPNADQTLSPPNVSVGGDGLFCRPVFAAEKFWYPQAKELAKLAFKKLEIRKYDDPSTIVPIYLYPQDCQVRPEQGRRVDRK